MTTRRKRFIETPDPKANAKLIEHLLANNELAISMLPQSRSVFAANTLTHPKPDVSIRAAYQGATIA
jgi:hypothetical protein